MDLSTNLTLEEVIRSTTAIRAGISNMPTKGHLANLKLIATHIFQPIRDHFGVAIFVSSGYRSAALNSLIPGASSTSYHVKGMALDLDQDYRNSIVSNADIFYYIRDNLDFSELIWEFGTKYKPDWVHVAYDRMNLNKEVLKSVRRNGRVSYVRI